MIRYSLIIFSVLDTELHFELLNQTSSDPSVTNATDAFDIRPNENGKSVEIVKSASYSPDPSQQLYFDLELEVRDSEEHASTGIVKIVIMTDMNNVTFGFDNSREEVESSEEELFRILGDLFEWSFSSRGIKESSTRAEGDFTTVEGYFVDPVRDYEPKTQLEIATKYDAIFDDLWTALHTELNISLDASRGFRGATTDSWRNPDTRAFIIVGSVTGGLVVVTGLFLLTAYILRTRALERRVRAMDTAAVDTKTEHMNGGAGAAKQQNNSGVPGMVDIPGDFRYRL